MRLTGAPIHGDVRDIRQGADKFIIIDNHAYYTTFSIEFSTEEGTIQFVDDQIGTLFEAEIANLMIDGVPASTNPLELEVQIRPFERDVFTVDDIIRARYFVWRHHSWEDGDSLIQNTVEGYIEVKTIEGTDYESRMNIFPQQIDMTVLEGEDYTTFLRMGAKDFLIENGVRAFTIDQNKIELKYNQTRLMVANEDVRLNMPSSSTNLELIAKPSEILARIDRTSSNTSGSIRIQPELVWISSTQAPMTSGGILIRPGNVNLQTATGQEGVMASINLNGEWGTIDHGHGNTPEPANAIATYQEVQDSIYVYTYTDTALGWQVEENQTLLFAHTDIQPDLTNYVQALITHTDAESKVTEKLILNEPTDASVYIASNYDNGDKIAAINLEGGWATVDQVGGVTPRPWDSIATIEDIDVYADQYTFVQDGWNWKAFQDDALIFTYTANTNIVPAVTTDSTDSLVIDTTDANLSISQIDGDMTYSISVHQTDKALDLMVENNGTTPTLGYLRLNDEFTLLGSTGAIFSENGYVVVDSETDTTSSRPQNSVVQYSELEGLVNTVDTLDLETYHDSEFTGKGTQNDVLKLKFDSFSLEKWEDGTLAVSDYPLLWEELEALTNKVTVLEKNLTYVVVVYPYAEYDGGEAVLDYYVTHTFVTKNVYARLEYAETGMAIHDFVYTPIDHDVVKITFQEPPEGPFEVKIDRWLSFSTELGTYWNIFFVDEDKDVDTGTYHVRTYGPTQVKSGSDVMFMCDIDFPVYIESWDIYNCDSEGVPESMTDGYVVNKNIIHGTSTNYVIVNIPFSLTPGGNLLIDATPKMSDAYNPYLAGLTIINNLPITPTFDPTTLEYELSYPVAWDYGNVTVEPVLGVPNQTWSRTVVTTDPNCSGRSYPNINMGKTSIKIVVYSPNQIASVTYYIILKKYPVHVLNYFYAVLDINSGAMDQLADLGVTGNTEGCNGMLGYFYFSGSQLLSTITLQNLPVGVEKNNPVEVKFAYLMPNNPGTSTEAVPIIDVYDSDGNLIVTTTSFYYLIYRNGNKTRINSYTKVCVVDPMRTQILNVKVHQSKDGIDSPVSTYTVSVSTSIQGLISDDSMFVQTTNFKFGHVWFRKGWKTGGAGDIMEMLFCGPIGAEDSLPVYRRIPDYTKFRAFIIGGGSTGGGSGGGTARGGQTGGYQEFLASATGTLFKYFPHFKTLELRRYIGAGGPNTNGGGLGPAGNPSYIRYYRQEAGNDVKNNVVFNYLLAPRGYCYEDTLGQVYNSGYYNSDITGFSYSYAGRREGDNSSMCLNNSNFYPGTRYTGQGGQPGRTHSGGGCTGSPARGGGGAGNVIMTYPYVSTNLDVPYYTNEGVKLLEVSPGPGIVVKDASGNPYVWITYKNLYTGEEFVDKDANTPNGSQQYGFWSDPTGMTNQIHIKRIKVRKSGVNNPSQEQVGFIFSNSTVGIVSNMFVAGDLDHPERGGVQIIGGSITMAESWRDYSGTMWNVAIVNNDVIITVEAGFPEEFYVLEILNATANTSTGDAFDIWAKPGLSGGGTTMMVDPILGCLPNQYIGTFIHAITMKGDPATAVLTPFFGRCLFKLGANTWVGIDQVTPGTGESAKSVFGVFTGNGTTNTPVSVFATSVRRSDLTETATVVASTTCTSEGKVYRWTNERCVRGSNTTLVNQGYKCWTLVLTIDTVYVPPLP
ncbi:Cadherin-like beta sandwich domain protein [Azobacteroides phage ProJPt-Bp1]|uniref:Cadherin-like beta sandwich domain protein n=1 Tax=Azobacteroides phage ProJPt-Bp1 TaxID=1920526 RepID=A0A1V1FMZ2_9CAUD|nr:Cadherin-like beta sandwich domain protein [Azobacteroides phage ProJPt-Bp1]BAX03420.1 Cadherin-like beta sandwich domain protein [Azobacteroides phage ProJPt-Bp1]